MSDKLKKVQAVFVVGEGKDRKSFTRHVRDGKIRSLNCPHGVKCTKCFVELEQKA